MKLHEVLPEDILCNLRQRQGLDEDDNSNDEQFDDMSAEDIIEEYLSYEGIIGFGQSILQNVVEMLVAFKQAKNIDIYDDEQRDSLLYDNC